MEVKNDPATIKLSQCQKNVCVQVAMINQNENLNPAYQLKRFYVSTDSDEIFRPLTKGKALDSQQRGFENQFANVSNMDTQNFVRRKFYANPVK